MCEAARENILATRVIKNKAAPDFHEGHLRVLKDNTTLPFDAGYAAMFIRPTWTTSAVDVPRFPDAKAAILYTGVHFGGITGGPTSTSGLRELM